jgi:hypothetical protein
MAQYIIEDLKMLPKMVSHLIFFKLETNYKILEHICK